ncbi:hypothetical protein ABIE65_004220 [Constrictibacter sp. MBR-5]|jgi:hypothetical protein|uniref:hypothetical protein n=1 Tax=Constrictibacter sp. MBR-5 TaxID=3156467 RepID=UPI0033970FD3
MTYQGITSTETLSAELRNVGNGVIAYTRPTVIEGVEGVAIHGADGTLIGVAPSVEHAIAAIRTEGMEYASLH